MKSSVCPQSVLQQMAQIQRMERGKLCISGEGPNGPYYNHQTWQDGKNVCRYVRPEEVAGLQEAIAGYQQFKTLSEQYAELIIRKTRAERASNSKKKSPPPNCF